MGYAKEFERGFAAAHIAETCPYDAGTPSALAWLDGISAARDRDREETLAGPCLAFAVLDARTDTYRALYRYAGQAIAAADALPSCKVVVVQIPAVFFEPDMLEEVETTTGITFDAAELAGKPTDLLDVDPPPA